MNAVAIRSCFYVSKVEGSLRVFNPWKTGFLSICASEEQSLSESWESEENGFKNSEENGRLIKE